MRIYYEVTDAIEIPDNLTEEEIDKLLQEKLQTDNFCWMYEQQYLAELFS